MTKLIKDLTSYELLSQLNTWNDFVLNQLGFDKATTIQYEFELDKLGVIIGAQDKFWEKLDYDQRIKLSVWETDEHKGGWDSLVKSVWAELEKFPKRPIRELRFSLICLSKVTETEFDIESEVARGIFAQIKELKNQLSERLLSYEPQTDEQ